MNLKGQVTDHCWMPKSRKQIFEDIPSMLKTWEWSDRYDWYHSNAVQPTPILDWRSKIRISWYMVLKVALKSRWITPLDLSREETMSFRIFSNVVSVICIGLYADWEGVCRFEYSCGLTVILGLLFQLSLRQMTRWRWGGRFWNFFLKYQLLQNRHNKDLSHGE